jgi:hypothetical protein
VSRSETTLFASLAAIPTIWFGGCLMSDARSRHDKPQGMAQLVVGAGETARHAAPILDGAAQTASTVPGAGDVAHVAFVAATFADTFAKQMDARLAEIEAKNEQNKTRSVQAEYIGAAVGSTLGASSASLAAYFAGRRRRKEEQEGADR